MAQLEVALDRGSDMPLGTQLAWQLRTLIAAGRLAEGERLPGVREMAAIAGVNVNTVRTVYGRLADEGLIVSEHGRGTFVGERTRARDELARLAHEAADTARAAGVAPRDLAVALYAEPAAEAATAPSPPLLADTRPPTGPAGTASSGERAPAAEARRRATLRAEIALLERELAALETPANGGEDTRPIHWERPPAPQLLTAAELEHTRDELVERLRPLRAGRDSARDAREREQAERAQRDIERHKAEPVRRQRAIATSTPRFESGAGGWSLRWRS
ncbi:MAG TPA: GntR family transcriptional regulator [Thermoleophilaceae bacterium]|jgi:DNA-binding transcriptional regulator YhcF (GntR family)